MPTYSLAKIAAAAQQYRGPEGVLVIAIDGPSGSGKSRLATRIARTFQPHTLFRSDALVAGWDGLPAVPHRLREVLASLRDGRPARYTSWDWSLGDLGPTHEVTAAPTIVIEGCGSGGLACADLVDFLIWVDAPAALRHSRAIARDGNSFAAHWQGWAAAERELYAADRVRERANLVIDGRAPVRK